MAASSALPPARRAATPDCDARRCGVATIPRGALASGHRVGMLLKAGVNEARPCELGRRAACTMAGVRAWAGFYTISRAGLSLARGDGRKGRAGGDEGAYND